MVFRDYTFERQFLFHTHNSPMAKSIPIFKFKVYTVTNNSLPNTMKSLKEKIPLNIAIITYILITIIALVYHVLILTQTIPYNNAWGGRLESIEQMYMFEMVSIVLQLLFVILIFTKSRVKENTKTYRITKPTILFIALLFLFNTLGNLAAIELFEKIVFTPLTMFAGIAALRVWME